MVRKGEEFHLHPHGLIMPYPAVVFNDLTPNAASISPGGRVGPCGGRGSSLPYPIRQISRDEETK
ncbi:MAG: hypothetical protein DHS20C16_00420 [Phycisphaerae bacterium]|nr:MAG: hypothetical protein DHS20C16_00420 [Phycisphaerae bacterium]